jgi:intein/homing endonuclease
MSEKPRKNKFLQILNNILNYVIFPAFFVGVFSVMIIFFTFPQNQMPQVFGHSIVRINTDSMVEMGFDIGDVVFVNQNKTKELKKGDIVAFYKIKDKYDNDEYNYNSPTSTLLVTIDEYEGMLAENVNYQDTYRTTLKTIQEKKEPIYFHSINEVYVSPDGIVFYQTKGSNPNASPDGFIRQDFIIAKYTHTPLFLKTIMSFMITKAGMIALVIFPLSLIVGYESLRILKRINTFMFENKVFNRKMRFDDPVLKSYDVPSVMSSPRKAYFWLTSKKEEKDKVFGFLYAIDDKSTKSAILESKNAKLATKIFNEKGALEFFRFWHSNCGGWLDKKEILKLKNQYEDSMKNHKHPKTKQILKVEM